jgi:uncharacterized protein
MTTSPAERTGRPPAVASPARRLHSPSEGATLAPATVIVTGDTHLPRFGTTLPGALVEGLKEADLVLHAGDLTATLVLELLSAFAPVEAVAGNNDPAALRSRLGVRRIVEVEGVRIGLTHGHAGTGRRTLDRAISTFAEERLDAVAFGHSHVPLVERRDGVWLLNPGSPTDKRRQPRYSYLRLRVAGGRIEPTLVEYESKESA